MKNLFALTLLFTGITNIQAQSCEDAFSAANYSVAHTTNAYESNNAAHVQEWSYKAMETFREVEDLTASCGCDDVANFAYEGYEAAEKSQEQNTWESSRFYAKRAKLKATAMIDALAICTNVNIADIENIAFEDRAYASNDDNLDAYYTAEDIAAEKAELLVQQKLIAEQEAALALRAEEKRLADEQLKAERALELEAQKTVKTQAEMALLQIKAGFESLANAVGCQQAYEMAKSSYKLTQEQLQDNSLEDTKLHYTLQLNELAEQAMLKFADCSENF